MYISIFGIVYQKLINGLHTPQWPCSGSHSPWKHHVFQNIAHTYVMYFQSCEKIGKLYLLYLLLVMGEGNAPVPPVSGGFPSKGSVMEKASLYFGVIVYCLVRGKTRYWEYHFTTYFSACYLVAIPTVSLSLLSFATTPHLQTLITINNSLNTTRCMSQEIR